MIVFIREILAFRPMGERGQSNPFQYGRAQKLTPDEKPKKRVLIHEIVKFRDFGAVHSRLYRGNFEFFLHEQLDFAEISLTIVELRKISSIQPRTVRPKIVIFYDFFNYVYNWKVHFDRFFCQSTRIHFRNWGLIAGEALLMNVLFSERFDSVRPAMQAKRARVSLYFYYKGGAVPEAGSRGFFRRARRGFFRRACFFCILMHFVLF